MHPEGGLPYPKPWPVEFVELDGSIDILLNIHVYGMSLAAIVGVI